jgi:hypothetical protein
MYELSDFMTVEHAKQGQMLFKAAGLFSLGNFIARTPCSRIPLEKLIVFQLVKEFPAYYQIIIIIIIIHLTACGLSPAGSGCYAYT